MTKDEITVFRRKNEEVREMAEVRTVYITRKRKERGGGGRRVRRGICVCFVVWMGRGRPRERKKILTSSPPPPPVGEKTKK
jgi:hypothetical protein